MPLTAAPCRACGERIALSYPAVELAALMIAASAYGIMSLATEPAAIGPRR
jgi:prepilin signal peptidase PulO-like enzyme (type II secretory pathway)